METFVTDAGSSTSANLERVRLVQVAERLRNEGRRALVDGEEQHAPRLPSYRQRAFVQAVLLPEERILTSDGVKLEHVSTE